VKDTIIAALTNAHERVYKNETLGNDDRVIFEKIAKTASTADTPACDLL
jgi:hypothetical protein